MTCLKALGLIPFSHTLSHSMGAAWFCPLTNAGRYTLLEAVDDVEECAQGTAWQTGTYYCPLFFFVAALGDEA